MLMTLLRNPPTEGVLGRGTVLREKCLEIFYCVLVDLSDREQLQGYFIEMESFYYRLLSLLKLRYRISKKEKKYVSLPNVRLLKILLNVHVN